MKSRHAGRLYPIVLAIFLSLCLAACGGAGSDGGGGNGGGGGGNPPATPGGLTATPGDQQVALTWTASSGATSYNLSRATTSGGPYTKIASPTATNYTDTSVTNGTTYYYVVAATNANGTSANSGEVSAKPSAPGSAINVSVDVLADRHAISPYIYGGSYPSDSTHVTDSGMTVVRWGGNATSTYNWKLFTNNSAADYYFEDFASCGLGGFPSGASCVDADSTQFITDVKAAGSHPLMTMVMLPWVAKSAETPGSSGNGHWSFSVTKYGSQCGVDQFNTDAGNGVKADCSTNVTGNDPNDAYFPLLDQPGGSDPPNSVYRNQWAAALATAFGSAPHFYDMDNEIDIWGGTHRDIHPNPSGYDELRDTYLLEARKLKTWDAAAIRFGPVSCCWWFYWNGENANDKAAHGNIDFLPWWLNEVYWRDQIDGISSLEVFDIHAYPEGPDDLNTETLAQKQASSIRAYRGWWDPTYVSENQSVNQPWATSIQPDRTISFRIPRMKALLNSIYPGRKFAITEWSTGFADNTNANPPVFDFSTAIADAMGYGILGQQDVYLASRWTAPDTRSPAYQALKLYRNYDGAHSTFGTTSVRSTHNGDPSLFATYAAVDNSGKLTLMVVNGDPSNAANVQFTLSNFTPSTFTSYSLTKSIPTITASGAQSWTSTQTFAPYSITLLVVSGTAKTPASEWELNPAEIMTPAAGTAVLSPELVSGSAPITLSSATFDAFAGAPACSGNITLTDPTITSTQPGTITFTAGATPGFCHFTVAGSDGTTTQTKGGWLVVGNPAATLTNNSPSSGSAGTQVTLSVTLNPGNSVGTPACGSPPCGPAFAAGASILFTVDSGTLSGGAYGNTTKRIATADGSGVATVTLTLPGTPGTVNVTAEGPYGLGHPMATFTETVQ